MRIRDADLHDMHTTSIFQVRLSKPYVAGSADVTAVTFNGHSVVSHSALEGNRTIRTTDDINKVCVSRRICQDWERVGVSHHPHTLNALYIVNGIEI